MYANPRRSASVEDLVCDICGQGRHNHPNLTDCMTALLNRMRVLSYGKAQQVGRVTRSSDSSEGGSVPSGTKTVPGRGLELERHMSGLYGERDVLVDQVTYWLERWGSVQPHGQLAVIQAARQALDRILFSQADRSKEETLDDLYQRIVDEGEGFSAKDVAVALKTSPKTVEAARLSRDREPIKGYGVEKPSDNEAKAKVRELHAKGCSARQIEKLTGVKRSTAQDWMRRNAA